MRQKNFPLKTRKMQRTINLRKLPPSDLPPQAKVDISKQLSTAPHVEPEGIDDFEEFMNAKFAGKWEERPHGSSKRYVLLENGSGTESSFSTIHNAVVRAKAHSLDMLHGEWNFVTIEGEVVSDADPNKSETKVWYHRVVLSEPKSVNELKRNRLFYTFEAIPPKYKKK